jgi:hypothetical protein
VSRLFRSQLPSDLFLAALFTKGRTENFLPCLPLLTREETWPRFDKARHHIEDCDAVPWVAIAHTESFFIQIANDAGIGKVLSQQLHHDEQHLIFGGIDFQALTIIRDT